MRDNSDGHLGAERREPRITQQDYLVLSRLSRLLRKEVEKHLPKQNGIVLDIGCGNKPYQPFFSGKDVLYLGADIKSGELVDILSNGSKLPFRDDTFLMCLCLQVLEHTDDPKTLLDEILRVLKPNGLLFLSTHGMWPVHDAPHDFWRWTEQGIAKMLDHFNLHEIHTCGGSAASIIQLLELYIPGRSLGVAAIFFLNRLANLLDRSKALNAKLPNLATNYVVMARKPPTHDSLHV